MTGRLASFRQSRRCWVHCRSRLQAAYSRHSATRSFASLLCLASSLLCAPFSISTPFLPFPPGWPGRAGLAVYTALQPHYHVHTFDEARTRQRQEGPRVAGRSFALLSCSLVRPGQRNRPAHDGWTLSPTVRAPPSNPSRRHYLSSQVPGDPNLLSLLRKEHAPMLWHMSKTLPLCLASQHPSRAGPARLVAPTCARLETKRPFAAPQFTDLNSRGPVARDPRFTVALAHPWTKQKAQPPTARESRRTTPTTASATLQVRRSGRRDWSDSQLV